VPASRASIWDSWVRFVVANVSFAKAAVENFVSMVEASR
jgi:hypothetical protein